MHRFTRSTLTSLNSSGSLRFHSPTGFPYCQIPRRSTPRPKIILLISAKTFSSAVPNPAGMDSDWLASSGFEDFVKVDGGTVSSEESSVSEEAADEEEEVSSSVNEESLIQTYERKVLPEEFSRNVMTLTCESSADGGICDVYLVGTAHVSVESCQEVEAVINFLKPQCGHARNFSHLALLGA